AAGVRYGGESIHEASVDLRLLLVKAVDEIPDALGHRNVLADIEGLVGELREPVIETEETAVRIHHARKRAVGSTAAIELRRGRVSLIQTFRARKMAVKVIERVVLEIDHDDMVDGNLGRIR